MGSFFCSSLGKWLSPTCDSIETKVIFLFCSLSFRMIVFQRNIHTRGSFLVGICITAATTQKKRSHNYSLIPSRRREWLTAQLEWRRDHQISGSNTPALPRASLPDSLRTPNPSCHPPRWLHHKTLGLLTRHANFFCPQPWSLTRQHYTSTFFSSKQDCLQLHTPPPREEAPKLYHAVTLVL